MTPRNKDNLRNILESLDPQGCLTIKGIEIIKYMYPNSILCSNSRCPKNKLMYLDGFSEQKLEKQVFIREECKICKVFTFEFPENIRHHIHEISHLNDILEKRKNITCLKKSINFLPIDLRKEKKDGILSKSHLIDFAKFHDKIAYDMIDDFIEFKDSYHFSFFISSNEGNMNLFKHKNVTYNEKFFTQPDEHFGLYL